MVRMVQADAVNEQSVQPCRVRGCSQLAFRSSDTLSYAAGHWVWTCVAGHEIAEERAKSGATPPPAFVDQATD